MCFIKQTGEKSGDNYKLFYHSCQKCGHNKPHRAKGEPVRKTNVKYKHGTIKIGKFCPVHTTLRIKPEETSVVYIKSHDQYLVSTKFQAKLTFGVPEPRIYCDFKSTLGGREQRSESEPLSETHLITKKSITDIKRVMNYGRCLHQDSITSTYLFVKKLEKESFNSIVVYKPQGETTVTGPKSYDNTD